VHRTERPVGSPTHRRAAVRAARNRARIGPAAAGPRPSATAILAGSSNPTAGSPA